ncbi:MAG: Thioredoxin reductase [uncultured Solirubrobacterales bacterium]|uniref:Thioredoxin reductase n=1 Tax=uncultured Solirubrobacterales bacterium TaxID=768556 RepID=A0A6J4T7V8_9ACTN|nr:MAG: Thioredoxin reductase [uncultured Solirubrobacterales bacterium]
MTELENKVEDVVIVGSGPAGYTAALYTSRADLRPLVIEGFLWGGLLQQTTEVENYPGFRDGIMGPALMSELRAQAERFGTRFVTDEASRIELARDGGLHRVWVGGREIQARTVILAMGAEPRKLGVPGEQELSARGVSYCATCDAAFFRDKPTMIIGGGDSAMEEAIFLSKFASDVKLVHRRSDFRASQIMLDRARGIENIEFLTPYVIDRFESGDGGSLARAVLAQADGKAIPAASDHDDDGATPSEHERAAVEVEIEGAFIAVGHRPNSHLVEGQVETDADGYVVTEDRSTRTNVDGVFAAGDLVDHTYRQAITAAGTGCQAALDAERWLRDSPYSAEAHWVSHDEVEAALEGEGAEAAA